MNKVTQSIVKEKVMNNKKLYLHRVSFNCTGNVRSQNHNVIVTVQFYLTNNKEVTRSDFIKLCRKGYPFDVLGLYDNTSDYQSCAAYMEADKNDTIEYFTLYADMHSAADASTVVTDDYRIYFTDYEVDGYYQIFDLQKGEMIYEREV